jgi:DNA-binding MarR family transcriptional regulator
MHAAYFGLKRSYWGSLATTRKRLKEIGLTAARFDMLYALLRHGTPVQQRYLVRKLGVTSPVVSRMLKSLRQLGYVERKRDVLDARAWLTFLTRAGRTKIREAIREFISSGLIAGIVEESLCPRMPPDLNRENEAFARMCQLEWILDTLRDGFRARGTLYYPWHPDD